TRTPASRRGFCLLRAYHRGMTRSTSASAAPSSRGALVVSATAAFEGAARIEAERLGLPFVADAEHADLALVLDERGWALADPRPGAPGAVRCDLLSGDLGERLRTGARGESRLAKALGLR